jgi:hypothetical protein
MSAIFNSLLKEELDKELKKHSKGKWVLALIVFLGIGVWLASFVPISTENVFGVLVTSTALQREDGNKRYLVPLTKRCTEKRLNS